MRVVYTAVFTPQETGTGYYGRVPDLDGCITTGSTLADAIFMMRDALSVYLLALEDTGAPIPAPRAFGDVPYGPDEAISLLEADTTAYRKAIDSTLVRKNVTIPAWMAYQAERLEINVSSVLREALEAILAENGLDAPKTRRGHSRRVP